MLEFHPLPKPARRGSWRAFLPGSKESYKIWTVKHRINPQKWFWSTPGEVCEFPCDSYADGVRKCQDHYESTR
jgi:hypothetical protein